MEPPFDVLDTTCMNLTCNLCDNLDIPHVGTIMEPLVRFVNYNHFLNTCHLHEILCLTWTRFIRLSFQVRFEPSLSFFTHIKRLSYRGCTCQLLAIQIRLGTWFTSSWTNSYTTTRFKKHPSNSGSLWILNFHLLCMILLSMYYMHWPHTSKEWNDHAYYNDTFAILE